MEAEAGRSLERFFERWIYGSTLPQLKISYRVDGRELLVRVEQMGELFDVPVTLAVQYADRKTADVLAAITERVTEVRLPVSGPVRGVEVSKDDGTLAEIVRN
jgi:aminopeptidase N